MTPIADLRVVIQLGGRRCVLDCATLEAAANVELRSTLIRLVLSADDIHSQGGHEGEPTEGMNVSDNENNNTSFTEPFVSSRKRESSQTSAVYAIDFATSVVVRTLPAALRDDHSDQFYRLVATALPLSTIRHALSLAMELEPSEIKRSRAAYFTALVRPHLKLHPRPCPPDSTPDASRA